MIVLSDWKTSTYKAVEMRLQLGAYFGCPFFYDRITGQTAVSPPIDVGVVMHVGEDGIYPLILMSHQELVDSWKAFQETLNVYRYLVSCGGLIPPESRYQINGSSYVSVTQVLQLVIAKPELLNWYSKMGREGKDPNEIKVQKGQQGSHIHKMIVFYLSGKSVDTTQAPTWISKTLTNFAQWDQRIKPKVMAIEQQVFHPDLGFAGTLDCLFECTTLEPITPPRLPETHGRPAPLSLPVSEDVERPTD